jgi:hypothetical protein
VCQSGGGGGLGKESKDQEQAGGHITLSNVMCSMCCAGKHTLHKVPW